MIINFRDHERGLDCADEEFVYQRFECFVGGAKIHQVWYIDTDKCIVKTYDVAGDGIPHTTGEGIKLFVPVEVLDGCLFSRTIRGNISLIYHPAHWGPR